MSRFKISDGKKTLIDTGVLHDKTYSGGRIGVMSFSQEKVSWSKIFYRCSGKARVRSLAAQARTTRPQRMRCNRLLKTGCSNVVGATLFLVVNHIEQYY